MRINPLDGGSGTGASLRVQTPTGQIAVAGAMTAESLNPWEVMHLNGSGGGFLGTNFAVDTFILSRASNMLTSAIPPAYNNTGPFQTTDLAVQLRFPSRDDGGLSSVFVRGFTVDGGGGCALGDDFLVNRLRWADGGAYP
jgi:hypothetical protein